MAEQLICNQQVVGSTPITSSSCPHKWTPYGRFPERPKGADCKSVVFRLRWSESTISHQQKTHFCLPTKVRFLNDVCLRQMMTASPNDVRFANDVWLRHILWQTSHHCDRREQHHICEANASYRRRRCII